MEWICFIFKSGAHHYLVSSDSEDNAFSDLASRQSMSVERCKIEYKLIKVFNGMGFETVIKL